MSWNLLRLFTPLGGWDSLTLEEPMSVAGNTELKVPVGSVEWTESMKITLETEKTKKISTGMVLQRSIFDILNRLYGVVMGELSGLNTFSPIKLGRRDLEKSSNANKRMLKMQFGISSVRLGSPMLKRGVAN